MARSATAFQDAVTNRAVPQLLELARAGIDLDDSGPELLKSAVAAEAEDAARTGEEAHIDILAAGADVHAEVDGRSLLVRTLHNEDDAYAQNREVHLDGSALLLAMGADPWRPPRGRTEPAAIQIAEKSYKPAALLYRAWREHGGGEAGE